MLLAYYREALGHHFYDNEDQQASETRKENKLLHW